METALYRLNGLVDGTDPRVERLTAEQAMVRNQELDRKGLPGVWQIDQSAEEGEVTGQPAKADTRTAKQKASDQLRTAQSDAEYRKSVRKETAMASQKHDNRHGTRAEWHGLSMCQVIRVCGANGIDKPTTLKVAEKCGFTPAAGTIQIQHGKGKSGTEKVPEIKGEYLDQIMKWAGVDGKRKQRKASKKTAAVSTAVEA